MQEKVRKDENGEISCDILLKYLLVADGIHINPDYAKNEKFMKLMEDVLTVFQKKMTECCELPEIE